MAVPSCCNFLEQALGSQLAYPNTTAYSTVQSSYWSLQEQDLRPSCIFTPDSASSVSIAVSALASNNCEFAIKSQGHAPAAGFANIDDGVTIDLTALNQVSLDAEKSVANVGAGASWLEVYTYLDSFNLTVAGGRNGRVGVGGLTLGGGVSYIGPRVGWACDNVVNFEIVLASGEIVNANASSHPDLFRGLKGGGNNFGIVTSISFQTFPQADILAGRITSPFSQLNAVFDAFASLANATDYDPFAELVTAIPWTPTTGWGPITHLAAYTKAEAQPEALQGILNIQNTTNTLHLTRISTWANESANPLTERLFFTGTYGISSLLMQEMIQRWDSILTSEMTIQGLNSWGFTFEPIPTIMTQYGDKNGGNSLGTSPQDGNVMILLLSAGWNDTASDAAVVAQGERLLNAADEAADSMGLLKKFVYANYAAPSQEPLESYGAENLADLRKVSNMYDPQGVFQRLVPGGFKL